MSVLDKVLTLRPANAVARLGPGSRLPVLTPHELLRALDSVPVALPCLPVQAKAALPGLLRAARAEDAVLGLACAHPLADRGAGTRFVEAVKAAAEEAEHRRPLFLQAGPVRVSPPGPEGLQAQQEAIFHLVDAGFSLVSLDVSRLDTAAAVEAVRALVTPLWERELPLELTLPSPASEVATLIDTARALLEGLREGRLSVRFLRVSSAALGEGEPDVAMLRALVALAREHGTSVTVGAAAERSARGLSTFVEAGARKLDCGAPFERLSLAAWPVETRAVVEQRAQALGLPPGELLSLLEEQLPPLEPAARERLEALSFSEATEVLAALGSVRTGWRSMEWLAEHRSD
ncbi:hypothetical protein [Stigmatella aurantiaca]|uniref:Conserved uncharacterized protein n=1 Tax=Stigmatella aurantiaca (strain DW4/3-1) TaxID=378806 RepID=Q091Y7_STIAD|nr:hypothetical protein [Stigmatella aurantiaca]ADO71642.1 conserved uncharacterized protein [Stigmatella aurantiaca DW4/3-1]EAU66525.1 hypothetical protein STIAU_2491 [Stigmatella aurantiaca DW4/3-1]